MHFQIGTYTFAVSDPFREGFPMSRAMAQELNLLRAQRLKQRTIKRLGGAGRLKDTNFPLIQEWLKLEEQRFEFTEATEFGTLDYEIAKYTGDLVQARAQAKGFVLTESEIAAGIELLLASPEGPGIIEHCQDVLHLKQESAALGLESLF